MILRTLSYFESIVTVCMLISKFIDLFIANMNMCIYVFSLLESI